MSHKFPAWNPFAKTATITGSSRPTDIVTIPGSVRTIQCKRSIDTRQTSAKLGRDWSRIVPRSLIGLANAHGWGFYPPFHSHGLTYSKYLNHAIQYSLPLQQPQIQILIVLLLRIPPLFTNRNINRGAFLEKGVLVKSPQNFRRLRRRF